MDAIHVQLFIPLFTQVQAVFLVKSTPEIAMTTVCLLVSIWPRRMRSSSRFMPFVMALEALSAEFWTMRACSSY